MSTQTEKLSMIASDAIEQIRYDREHAGWLEALMIAIRTDAKHNQGRKVVDLANLGQYLAHDLWAYSDGRASTLQSDLDAAEGATK